MEQKLIGYICSTHQLIKCSEVYLILSFFICSYNSLQYPPTNIFMYFMQLHDTKVVKVRDSSGKMMALQTKKWQNPKELKILLNLQVSTFFFFFYAKFTLRILMMDMVFFFT